MGDRKNELKTIYCVRFAFCQKRSSFPQYWLWATFIFFLNACVTAEPPVTEYRDTAVNGSDGNAEDLCPDDPNKTEPGECGCGKSDSDGDEDGVPDCHDVCPTDENKADLGECGCGVEDVDSDGDGIADCKDFCPRDPVKSQATS